MTNYATTEDCACCHEPARSPADDDARTVTIFMSGLVGGFGLGKATVGKADLAIATKELREGLCEKHRRLVDQNVEMLAAMGVRL